MQEPNESQDIAILDLLKSRSPIPVISENPLDIETKKVFPGDIVKITKLEWDKENIQGLGFDYVTTCEV
jgi:hypothetical protein